DLLSAAAFGARSGGAAASCGGDSPVPGRSPPASVVDGPPSPPGPHSPMPGRVESVRPAGAPIVAGAGEVGVMQLRALQVRAQELSAAQACAAEVGCEHVWGP